jgi:hypothetical protein
MYTNFGVASMPVQAPTQPPFKCATRRTRINVTRFRFNMSLKFLEWFLQQSRYLFISHHAWLSLFFQITVCCTHPDPHPWQKVADTLSSGFICRSSEKGKDLISNMTDDPTFFLPASESGCNPLTGATLRLAFRYGGFRIKAATTPGHLATSRATVCLFNVLKSWN